MVFAVLVHDGQTLDALLLRSAFRHIDDLRIEIAVFAGNPFVDGIGNHMGDAAPTLRRRVKAWPTIWVSAKTSHRRNSTRKWPSWVCSTLALHQGLGVDRLPIGEAGLNLQRLDGLG